MDKKKKQLEVGYTIDIERTDGRIHAALVTDINLELNLVSVEWYENSETKGKDIDFINIIQLNPDYYITTNDLLETNYYLVNNTDDNKKSRQTIAETMDASFLTNRSINNNNNTAKLTKSKILINESSIKNSPNYDDEILLSKNLNNNSNNTLNKIYKIETHRLERRKKHIELEMKKNLLIKKNCNNPNWELVEMIKDYCKNLDMRPLTINTSTTDTKMDEDKLITVCVRKRPINKNELLKKEIDIITIPSEDQLIVHEPKNKVDLTKYLNNQLFKFDYTFNENCTNELIYKYTAQPLIRYIFKGGFATCFAYGQTGSGKTYTMSGDLNKTNPIRGIYSLTITDIFYFLNLPQYKHYHFIVSCSFFEIYSGKILDLLNSKATLKLLEDGKQHVQVIGLSEKVVNNESDVFKLIKTGNQYRSSGQTSANLTSSRSHAIFQIYLRTLKKKLYGKFSLIDLAGNERGADTVSSGKLTRREGGEINKSLLALKECIRALGRKSTHIPFRASKLTQVLRDSFIGNNSPICMIAMISPGNSSCENTLNTLRYADRVKELDGGDVVVQQQQQQLQQHHHLNTVNEVDETIYENLPLVNKEITELEIIKEKVGNCHKQFIDKLKETSDDAKYLLNMFTNDIYKEMYCKNFGEIVDDLLTFSKSVKECILEYKEQMNECNDN